MSSQLISQSLLDLGSMNRCGTGSASAYAKEIDSIMYRSKRGPDNIFNEDPLSLSAYNVVQNPGANFRINNNVSQVKPTSSVSDRVNSDIAQAFHKPILNKTKEQPREGLYDMRTDGKVYDYNYYDNVRDKTNEYFRKMKSSAPIASNAEFTHKFNNGDFDIDVDNNVNLDTETRNYGNDEGSSAITFSIKDELAAGYSLNGRCLNEIEPIDSRIHRIEEGDLISGLPNTGYNTYMPMGRNDIKLQEGREYLSKGERMRLAVDMSQSKETQDKIRRQEDADIAANKRNRVPRTTVTHLQHLMTTPSQTYTDDDIRDLQPTREIHKIRHEKHNISSDTTEQLSNIHNNLQATSSTMSSSDQQQRNKQMYKDHDVRERFVQGEVNKYNVNATISAANRTVDGNGDYGRKQYSDEKIALARDEGFIEEIDEKELPKTFLGSLMYGVKSMLGMNVDNRHQRVNDSSKYQLTKDTQAIIPDDVITKHDISSDDEDLIDVEDRHTMIIKKEDKLVIFHRQEFEDGSYDYVITNVPTSLIDNTVKEAVIKSEKIMKDKRMTDNDILNKNVLAKDVIEVEGVNAIIINQLVDALGDQYKIHSVVPVDRVHEYIDSKDKLNVDHMNSHMKYIEADVDSIDDDYLIIDQTTYDAGELDDRFKETYHEKDKQHKRRDIDTQLTNQVSVSGIKINNNELETAPIIKAQSQLNTREKYGVNSNKTSHNKDYRQITKRFDNWN